MAAFRRCAARLSVVFKDLRQSPPCSRCTLSANRTSQSRTHENIRKMFFGNKGKIAATVGTTWALLGFSWGSKETLSENDQVRKKVSAGIMAKENGSIKEASNAFHDALTMSTNFLKESKITESEHLNHRVFIYDQIANMTMEAGHFEAAEAVFKDTMKLALQLGMSQEDNAMIEMSLKLAMIYQYTGRSKIAVEGLMYCVQSQEKKVMKDNKTVKVEDAKTEEERENLENTWVLLGKSYKNLAYFYLEKSEYQRAESYLLKALDISKTVLGTSHDTTFVMMNDLATCYLLLREYEKAERVLTEGMGYSQKASSIMEAAFTSNLGALYIRTNKFVEAENICTSGLKIAEKKHDEFLKTPNKACLAKLKELKEANKY